MASFMDNLREKVKANPKTIVLAEGYDERHVKAAVILKKKSLLKALYFWEIRQKSNLWRKKIL